MIVKAWAKIDGVVNNLVLEDGDTVESIISAFKKSYGERFDASTLEVKYAT